MSLECKRSYTLIWVKLYCWHFKSYMKNRSKSNNVWWFSHWRIIVSTDQYWLFPYYMPHRIIIIYVIFVSNFWINLKSKHTRGKEERENEKCGLVLLFYQCLQFVFLYILLLKINIFNFLQKHALVNRVKSGTTEEEQAFLTAVSLKYKLVSTLLPIKSVGVQVRLNLMLIFNWKFLRKYQTNFLK